MSRIDEALKRAKAGSARAAAVAEGGVQGTRAGSPRGELFTDVWTADGEPATPSAAERPLVERPAVERPAAERAVVDRTAVDIRRPAAPAPAASPASLALFHGFKPELVERIVATPESHPAFVEQYRRLAGTLHHAQVERGIRVVMVTSALAGEGKSLTATNLALTFSESYRRSVLLIDADLRRPTLHDTFQVPNVVGLGDGLRADTDQKLSVVQVSPRLTLLTAGRPDPDPMSGLTSDRMQRVIEEASSRYDWVLVDTPPVGLLPDAGLLAAMVDTALLVVHAGVTPYSLIQRAVAAIGRERIIGVVLNRAEAGAGGSYSYYSYYEKHGRKSQ